MAAREILERRGSAPRLFRNMLVFLAADQRRLDELEQAAADFLAWDSVHIQAVELNLDEHQRRQAQTKRDQANQAVDLRIAETFQWLLVPAQPEAKGPTTWDAVKADQQAPLAVRSSRRLVHEGLLQTQYPPVLLRLQLDTTLAAVWEDGHVRVSDLWDAFARYPYLPRLRDVDVLLGAVRQGPAATTWQREGFATAVADDEASGRYLGLSVGSHPTAIGPTTLLVKPEIALGQLEAEHPAAPLDREHAAQGANAAPGEPPAPRPPRRFHGAVTLDSERLVRDFGKVAQEVVQHLTSLVGAQVEITVEIAARSADGFGEQVVRTVSENARTLKFSDFGFEEQ